MPRFGTPQAWHLRKAWAPLTYTDQDPPRQTTRSPQTHRFPTPRPRPRPPRHTGDDGQSLHDFRSLLAHLATLTRNTVTFTGAGLRGTSA